MTAGLSLANPNPRVCKVLPQAGGVTLSYQGRTIILLLCCFSTVNLPKVLIGQLFTTRIPPTATTVSSPSARVPPTYRRTSRALIQQLFFVQILPRVVVASFPRVRNPSCSLSHPSTLAKLLFTAQSCHPVNNRASILTSQHS